MDEIETFVACEDIQIGAILDVFGMKAEVTEKFENSEEIRLHVRMIEAAEIPSVSTLVAITSDRGVKLRLAE